MHAKSTITNALYDFVCEFYKERWDWDEEVHSIDGIVVDLMKGVVNVVNCLNIDDIYEEDEEEYWSITDKGRRWLEYLELRKEFEAEDFLS